MICYDEERSDNCLVAPLLVSVVRSSLFAQRAVIVLVANSLQQQVTLHYNQLSGPIPKTIKNCKKLKEFSVHHNLLACDIESICYELCSLPELERLFLNNNQIEMIDAKVRRRASEASELFEHP